MGSVILTIQKPGRVAEIRPGKRCGVVFDFLFEPPRDVCEQDMKGQCWQPVWESNARRAYYTKKGFEVYIPRNATELAQMFNERCV